MLLEKEVTHSQQSPLQLIQRFSRFFFYILTKKLDSWHFSQA